MAIEHVTTHIMYQDLRMAIIVYRAGGGGGGKAIGVGLSYACILYLQINVLLISWRSFANPRCTCIVEHTIYRPMSI